MKSMEVEVPITPMLDMAFQLLTFFILTYKPAPSEVQFSMNLLPAQTAIAISKEQPKSDAPPSVDASLRTLTTVLRAGGNDSLEVTLNDKPIQNMDELRKELESFVNDPILSFDQALIKVDPHLKYSEVIKVIDVFSSLKPKPLTKISFAELNPNEGGGPP
jgi:biopolymer transport protein ExbD